MKILLISPFFFPEQMGTGKYNTYLAKALNSKGHEVTVLASHPIYPNWHVEVSNASIPGIEIKRGGSWVYYPRSIVLRRVTLELWFTVYALWNYFKIKQFDIIIPVFPPSLFFLILDLFASRNISRVGIVHDLQGVYAARYQSILSRLIGKAIHFVEKRCFNRCDKIIFVSSSMANRSIREYNLDEKKCVTHYPFVAASDDNEDFQVMENVLLSNKINVIYSGALGEKQNPDGLFAFMQALSDTQANIACHIFSAGPLFEKLHLESQSIVNCGVQFHNLVPIEQLSALYTRSDIQIVPQASNTWDGSLPSKLPNLLAAGVPVFAICEQNSELCQIITDTDSGVVANTWDPYELVRIFNTHINDLMAETKLERCKRLQSFIDVKFSINSVVESIINAATDKP